MDKKPFFSVIVPAFNAQSLVSECIRSVLSQTETNFELIMIDDGSTDNTLSVMQEYAQKDARIKVFHQENKGHTGARNTGLSHACGEYVLFLDCDDGLEERVLAECKRTISQSGCDIVIFGICQYTSSGKKQFQNLVEDGVYHLKDEENNIYSQLLMSPNGTFTFPKSLSGKAFRKELILKCQPDIPTEILMGEDGIAFIKSMLLAERVAVISHVNYLYYVRTDSVSHINDRYAFRRFATLLAYYREQIVPYSAVIKQQFDCFVVAQLDTAVRFMLRSRCNKNWFRKEWEGLFSQSYVRLALKNARFSKTCYKMRIKQFLLRHQLFWVSKLLFKI